MAVSVSKFAAQMRALMAARGIGGTELARQVYVDAALISRYRSGKQRPSKRMAGLIDTALGAGGELAALASTDAAPDRRSVLTGGLIAGALLSIGPDMADRLAWAQHHPQQIDMEAVHALAEVLASQRRADDCVGSAIMLRPALAQLAAVENLVQQASAPIRPAVLNVAQEGAQFSGWLCRNTADWDGARACLAQALEWATELGDRTMISTILAEKSEMASLAGQAGTAIGLAQAAQRDTRAATEQRALAAEYEARGHALAGDAAAADRKLGEAQDLAAELTDRQDRRSWLYWMTPGYFANQAGITCAYLATDPSWHSRAIALLDVADSGTTAGAWASAENLTYLAFAHMRAGDPEQACGTAVAASAAVRRSGSARCAVVLDRVHADLSDRWPGDPRVAELADVLA